jgi:hypothetical protein
MASYVEVSELAGAHEVMMGVKCHQTRNRDTTGELISGPCTRQNTRLDRKMFVLGSIKHG